MPFGSGKSSMKYSKFLLFIALFLSIQNCLSQHKDSVVELNAFRPGFWFNPKTGETKDFNLCGDDVSSDSAHFFYVLSGCERNMHLLVGKYSFARDTFQITPFNFILEDPFVKIYKRK